jgi:hypothetical protein
MSFTMPEGIPTLTPTPVTEPVYVNRPSSIGSPSFLAAISIIIGIVVGLSALIGSVGKAFYVERSEYNLTVVRTAEDRTMVGENLKQMREALARQEASLRKLTEDTDGIKQSLASMRGGKR